MPVRADLEAAVPKCPGAQTNVMIGRSQHHPCGRPMVWVHELGFWRCTVHGRRLDGEQAAQLEAA